MGRGRLFSASLSSKSATTPHGQSRRTGGGKISTRCWGSSSIICWRWTRIRDLIYINWPTNRTLEGCWRKRRGFRSSTSSTKVCSRLYNSIYSLYPHRNYIRIRGNIKLPREVGARRSLWRRGPFHHKKERAAAVLIWTTLSITTRRLLVNIWTRCCIWKQCQ
jgi:hypothetical protein